MSVRYFFVILAAGALLALSGPGSRAAHDLGNDCYHCHTLSATQVIPGTRSISTEAADTGTPPGSTTPLRCDYCHPDYGAKFSSSVASGHPVQVIVGDNLQVLVPRLYPASPILLDCRNCHQGNQKTGGKIPDLAPQYYAPNGAGTGGYPDHDFLGTQNGSTVGDPPHLGTFPDNVDQDNNILRLPAGAAALNTNFGLCFACHNNSGKTTGTKDIQADYATKGHYFKTAGSFGGNSWNAGDRMPCSDCHASHSSATNKFNFSPDPATFSGAAPINKTTNRAICLTCHNGYGGTPSSVTVRGRAPTARSTSVTAHDNASSTPCSDCHNAHNPPAGGDDCLTCHRTGGGVTAKHQMTDLEFPADGPVAEDNPSIQVSGHKGVSYTSPYNTKSLNECKKCHGTAHPSDVAKVQAADGSSTWATGFVYGLSWSGSAWSANDNAFADGNGNGIMDGNEFCLSCHDGADALSPTDNANIRIGGVNPPKVWFPSGGQSTGHDRKAGSNYPVSNHAPAQQLCTSCHKYHTSDRQQLFPGNTGPYGAGNGYTYAMPTWGGIATNWQAPKPSSSTFPSSGGRVVVGNVNANALVFTDRSNPSSGKGFGTAGDNTGTNGFCNACHRDSNTVTSGTLNAAHTHEGNGVSPSKNVFVKDCVECHNPHGGGSAPNISMIREFVGRDNVTQNAVVFTARTGANSFDENDGGTESNADDLCATCHNNPAIGHNYRTYTGAATHYQGSNCVSCHSHGVTDNAAKFGFAQGSCNGCHTYPGLATVSGTHRLSAVHDNHVGRPGDEAAIPNRGYDCGKCHNGSDHNTAGISDKTQWGQVAPGVHVQVRFDPFNPTAAGGNPGDVRLSSTFYDNGTKTCNGLYCHGTTLSGAGGSKTSPAWDNALSGRCGTCHDTGTGDSTPGTTIGSRQHGPHLTASIGPRADCTDCHHYTTVEDSRHVDNVVTFSDNQALSGTASCDACHNGSPAVARAEWGQATGHWLSTTGGYCEHCHDATPSTVRTAAGTGGLSMTAPNVMGDNAVYGAQRLGHNRPTSAGAFPGSGNPAANRGCADCHKTSLPHIDNVNDNSYSGNRLSDNVNAVTGLSTTSGLCAACHTNPGSPTAGKNKVNTHGNTGFSGINHDSGAQDFAYNCDACHEPHGLTNNGRGAGTYNIYMIKAGIEVRNFSTGQDTTPDNTTTTGPVYFESRTGSYSFDDNTSSDASRLCVTCHVNGSRPGNSSPLNVTGGGGSHSGTPGGDYTTDERGKDCSSCHNHNKDDNTATVDGLMPQQCNGCHSYPGLDNSAVLFPNQRQMSRGHWDHVGKPLTGGQDNSHAFQCTVCHLNYQHNQSNIPAGGSWGSFNPNTVNMRFDASWNAVNANGPRYNGVLADPANGTVGIGGTGVCAGLYCHGNNATSSAGWNGSAPTPRWDNVGGAPCGACHDTGTADTTAGTRQSTGNHPVHLDNASRPYGPETWRFSAGGNCAEGAGCHTRYALTPNDTHVNGAVNFRTSLADNTPAVLPNTQICRNCHTTYTSAQISPAGDDLVRTPANWDNASYKTPCITCHNGGSGTQGWQNLDGSGDRAPAIEGTYYGNGHGAPGIDNASTTTDSGTTDQTVPVRCETCHDEQGAHIGTAKDTVNPWRLDNALTLFTKIGGLDNACLSQCHTATPASHPARHAWRVNSEAGGPPAQTRDNTVHTHPTSMQMVPTNKDRWFLVPSNLEMPVQADLSTKSPPARGSGTLLVCVTCHDPHGVGAAQTATRTFWGANDNVNAMLRYKERGAAQTPLCAKCHE